MSGENPGVAALAVGDGAGAVPEGVEALQVLAEGAPVRAPPELGPGMLLPGLAGGEDLGGALGLGGGGLGVLLLRVLRRKGRTASARASNVVCWISRMRAGQMTPTMPPFRSLRVWGRRKTLVIVLALGSEPIERKI